MDKHELRSILFTGILLTVFLFAVIYSAFSRRIDVPACVPYSGAFRQPHVKQIDSATYEVYAVAKMWSFEPSEIYLPVGSEVDFYLTSADVVHGFNIVDKNANLMAVQGAINKTTVKFDKPGVYRVVCHEFCGNGHQNMQGEIIVNYK